jgi:hypothetical protein
MSVAATDSHLEYALALAAKGFRVFPCYGIRALSDGRFVCDCGSRACKSPGKHPHGRYARNGLLNASAKSNIINGWWWAIPQANIGLATDGLVVVDVDPHKGGADSLARLEGEHGELPLTWRSLTGGGGEHVFFRAPAGAEARNSVATLAPGIDIRAAGGYVVGPPSLHLSGRRYAWSVDHHPDETPLADAPQWLVKATAEKASAERPRANDNSLWLRIARDGISEGARNNSIARLSGHLLRRYVDPHVTLELMMALNAARFQPPLDADEVRKIVSSIASKELTRREAGSGR